MIYGNRGRKEEVRKRKNGNLGNVSHGNASEMSTWLSNKSYLGSWSGSTGTMTNSIWPPYIIDFSEFSQLGYLRIRIDVIISKYIFI